MTSATVLLYRNGILETQRKIEDLESFVSRTFKALGYKDHAVMAEQFVYAYNSNTPCYIDNDAANTRFEFV